MKIMEEGRMRYTLKKVVLGLFRRLGKDNHNYCCYTVQSNIYSEKGHWNIAENFYFRSVCTCF